MEFKISSDTIGAISEALAKAQGSMGKAIKDSLNPHFRSKYADLASIMDASQKPLSENHLSFSSSITIVDGLNILVGTLSHSSGEWMRSYIPLVMMKQDMQGMGAAISYARRFALAALCGVAVSDDDAESVVNHNEEPKQEPRISDAQLKYLCNITDVSTQEKIKSFYKIEDLKELSISQAKACIDRAKGDSK
jgi:hypothetical protein